MAPTPSVPTLQPAGFTGKSLIPHTQSLQEDSTLAEPPYKPSFSSEATSLLSTAQIVCGFLAAAALTAGHHILLSYLDGRDVKEFDQFWIKNASNGFASVFSICIGFAATCALTQSKWSIVGTRAMPIKAIDNLFALPSPLAVAGTFIRLQRPLLLPIFASVLIQALVFVSVLAPNALTIAQSGLATRNLEIPAWEFYKRPLRSVDYPNFSAYSNVSSTWKQLINTLIINPPEMNWKIPLACGPTCDFEFMYDAPALDCRDTTMEEYTLRYGDLNYAHRGKIYEGSSTLTSERNHTLFWDNLRTPLADLDEQYDLSINYAILTPEKQFVSLYGGGSYCHFRNATYKASFALSNNTKAVSTTIVSYGGILGGGSGCGWESGQHGWGEDPHPEPDWCQVHMLNTRATCEAFAMAFKGNLRYDEPSLINYSENYAGVRPLMTFIDNTGNVGAVESMFNLTDLDGVAWTFSPSVSNISEHLVGLFSNVTLGLIPYRNETATVKGTVWDGTNVWIYRPWVLWAVYLPALLLAIPVTLNGLFSVLKTNTGMDVKFSDFLITTRNPDLDDACRGAVNFEALQRVRLMHHRKGAFSVESGGNVH